MDSSVNDWITFLTPYATAALGALASFLAAAIVGWIAHSIILRAAQYDPSRRPVLKLLAGIARVTIMVVGAVVALDTLGVQVGALIAGLGLTGFALGFALKDILSSTIAGVLILLTRPFRPGDMIKVTDFQGRVVDVNLRYTVIEDDKKLYLIPNATVLSSPVTVDKPDAVEVAAITG